MIIDLPKHRSRWATFQGPGAAQPGAQILGFEVTQAIQNMAHDVRLIAGKATVVRVYLDPKGLTSNVRVRGEIVISPRPGAPGVYVSSDNETTLKAKQQPGLAEQRRDAALSLNFRLPASAEGDMTIQLKRITPVSGGPDFPILPAGNEVQVKFVRGPVLRMRVLGLRYIDRSSGQPKPYAPDPIHFKCLHSYLRRTYPVSAVDWSQAVIDAPANFAPPFSGTLLPDKSDPLWQALLKILHRHMLAIRQNDMNENWDPRTHYYGLVSDHAGNFFRGAANDVPARPAPNTIAVGPCGTPKSKNWDQGDGSYGDWYGAHELAHTFGRFHPGFCGEQDDSDKKFPHPRGEISQAAEGCIGFDTGDVDLKLAMRACPHDVWHDIMTYCDWQWISKYTYDAIHDRLMIEETQFAPH